MRPFSHPIAKNGIGLTGAAPVQPAVLLALFAPDAATTFQSYIRPNYFPNHIDYLRMVNQYAGRAAGHVAVFGRQRFGIVFNAVDLIDDGGDFDWLQDGGAH